MGSNLAYARSRIDTNPREAAAEYACALRQLITDEKLITQAVQRRFPNYAGPVPFNAPEPSNDRAESMLSDIARQKAMEFASKELLKALWREHEPILMALERQGNGRTVVHP